MEKYLEGTWEEFEQWIRFTIGSGFRWHVTPLDNPSTRQMVADLVLQDIHENNGAFPQTNAFIGRK